MCFVGLAALAVFAFGEFGRLAVLIGFVDKCVDPNSASASPASSRNEWIG